MATIVRSVYNSLTREATIEQIQEVLKAYEDRIREIRHDTDRLNVLYSIWMIGMEMSMN